MQPIHLTLGVVVAPALAFSMRAALGVQQYLQQHRPEVRMLVVQSADSMHPRIPEMSAVMGYINPEEIAQLEPTGLPIVSIASRTAGLVPCVLTDHDLIGRMGAAHLHERGFRRIGFLHFAAEKHLGEPRAQGCADWLDEQGLSLTRMAWAGDLTPTLGSQLALCDAVMTASDSGARRLIEIMLAAGRTLPRDMAVLGVDNDESMCMLASVPISSVDTAGERLGYEAARLVTALLDGDPPPSQPVRIAPTHVVTRASTDVIQCDGYVRQAVEVIHRWGCEPFHIDQVMEHIPISRRTLEKQFRQQIGRTIHQELTRHRMEQARVLLEQTDLPVAQIARRCGFSEHTRFTAAFSTYHKIPPAAYRKSHQTLAQA